MEIPNYFMAITVGIVTGIAAGWIIPITKWFSAGLGDRGWLAALVPALMAGGAVLTWLDPGALPVGVTAPIEMMVGAGLLLGFVARIDVGHATLLGWRLNRPRRREFGHQ
jgi:hypothetical protein